MTKCYILLLTLVTMDETTLDDPYNHAQKQLQFALDFVSGPGDLQEKICDAFKSYLLLLRPDDFPVELRQDFASLINEFYRSGVYKYGINCDRSHYLISENQSIDLVGKMITLQIQLITSGESRNEGNDPQY
jgi:hypothetical protein